MDGVNLYEAGMLAGQCVVACTILLWFFRLRHYFGLAPLYITLGTFQHLQTQLAASVYVEVLPGIVVSPGSTVLFTLTLFVVLLLYIREDAGQARSLIVGVVAANLTLSVLSVMISAQVPAADLGAQVYLVQNLKTFLVGTCTLVIDVVLIIVLYEAFFKLFPRSLFQRIFFSMLAVVTVDTVLFVSANFYGTDRFAAVLWSGLLGKSVAALIYSLMLTVFLRHFKSVRRKMDDAPNPASDIFHILTYRQRYHILKDELTRDPLTGLFNRGFFNDNLDREMGRAARLDHELCLIILDIDHFKHINDTYGHPCGDEVIVHLARAMQKTFRAADIPCRYGGEEFVVIMPDAGREAAANATRRLQALFRETATGCHPAIECQLTFTAGVACYPDDAQTPDDLLRIADERLYRGKRSGRDRVVSAGDDAGAEKSAGGRGFSPDFGVDRG